MTPHEARISFADRLAEREENRKEAQTRLDRLNRSLLADYETAAATKLQTAGKGRGRKLYTKVLTQAEIDAIKARRQNEYSALVATSNSELLSIDHDLQQLAEVAEIWIGGPRTIRTFTAYDFLNQPEAAGYAKNVAASFVECYRTFGQLKADLVTAQGGWAVQVHVATDLDLEILRRRGEGPLKEVVQVLLKHGVNPQVLNPNFPYPEQLELDWSGNDLKPPENEN
jgi:hypothetical protein